MVAAWLGVVLNRGRIQGHYFAHQLVEAESPDAHAYYFSRLAGLGAKASGAVGRLSRHASADVRSLGVALAQQLKTDFGRELLLERLGDADREVRQMAALGLAFHHRAEALPVIVEMANEPGESPALAAAAALERIGGEAAIGALLAAAKGHGTTPVRAQAIDSLGRLEAEAAIGALIELLGDETEIEFVPATDLAALRAIEMAEHSLIQQGINPDEVEVGQRGPATIGAMAARSLRRITGESFGFGETEGVEGRKEAAEMWRKWYAARRPTSQPQD
jgi:HEAT repeat protein